VKKYYPLDVSTVHYHHPPLESDSADLFLGIQRRSPSTRKGKGKITKGMKPTEASDVEDPTSAEETEDDHMDSHKKALPSGQGMYGLPPSPFPFEKQ